MAFRVVITDLDFPSTDRERAVLSGVPAELIVGQCRTEGQVLELARNADGMLVQYAPISRRVVQKLHQCRVIARYGIGVDTIDVSAATEAGVIVCNVPEYCVDEVSEHTLSLLLALSRQLLRLASSVKAGRWSVTEVAPTIARLTGQRLGLVGFGAIARAVATKARALGLEVMAFDPYVADDKMVALQVERSAELVSLLRKCDFVSLHVPLIASTRHLIGTAELAAMKGSAYLINVSRGGLVDEVALYEALVGGRIAGAALDVLEEEPAGRNPLLDLESVIVTPHAAFYSTSSLAELQTKAAEAVATVLSGGIPRSALNPEAAERRRRLGGR